MKKLKIMETTSFYVLSLELKDNCQDCLCLTHEELKSDLIKYKEYAKANGIQATIVIHRYDKRLYPASIFDKQNNEFFDYYFNDSENIISKEFINL